MPWIVDGYGEKAWVEDEQFEHLALNGQTPLVWVEREALPEPTTPSTEAPVKQRKGWPKGKPRAKR